MSLRRNKRKYQGSKIMEKCSVLRASKLGRSLFLLERTLDSHIRDSQEAAIKVIQGENKQNIQTLRIRVINTPDEQASVVKDARVYRFDHKLPNGSHPPSWTLRIEGEILGAEVNDAIEDDGQRPPKFSSFFRKVVVCIDPEGKLYQKRLNVANTTLSHARFDNHEKENSEDCRDKSKTSLSTQDENYWMNNLLEWNRDAVHEDTDGFEVKRADVNVEISLFLKNNPTRVRLSPALSRILQVQNETRAGVLRLLLEYISVNKLTDKKKYQMIILDENLKEIFGGGRENISSIAIDELVQKLENHLGPLPPVTIKYRVNVKANSDSQKRMKLYDVPVVLPGTPREKPTENEFGEKSDDEVPMIFEAWTNNDAIAKAKEEDIVNFVKKCKKALMNTIKTVDNLATGDDDHFGTHTQDNAQQHKYSDNQMTQHNESTHESSNLMNKKITMTNGKSFEWSRLSVKMFNDLLEMKAKSLKEEEEKRWSNAEVVLQEMEEAASAMLKAQEQRNRIRRFSSDPFGYIQNYINSEANQLEQTNINKHEIKSKYTVANEPEEDDTLYSGNNAVWLERALGRYLLVQPYMDKHAGRARGRNEK